MARDLVKGGYLLVSHHGLLWVQCLRHVLMHELLLLHRVLLGVPGGDLLVALAHHSLLLLLELVQLLLLVVPLLLLVMLVRIVHKNEFGGSNVFG